MLDNYEFKNNLLFFVGVGSHSLVVRNSPNCWRDRLEGALTLLFRMFVGL